MKKREKSQKIYESMSRIIPGGVNSPVRAAKNMGQMPLIVASAHQDTLIDADAHTYIDYCGSWGSLIHGHAHPTILEGVQKRMALGTSFGVTTPVEGELAQAVIAKMPSMEKIRFVSSGTEATMSAVRLARGFTGKEFVVKFSGNYHGHADFFLVQAGSGLLDLSSTASSAGVPQEMIKYTLSLPYNDVEAFKALCSNFSLASRIAAVILEPIAGNMGVVPASAAFLHCLREETSRLGALLIFDEVISGFRVGLSGAQGLYGIQPDLTCLGKIIGGGFPAAAFGGKREIMDFLAPLGPVYQAGTLSGNPVAMQAGLEALKLIEGAHFYDELQRKTDLLLAPIREKIREKNWNVCLQEAGSMFTLFFGRKKIANLQDAQKINVELYAELFRFMFERGIYIPPSPYEAWFVSAAHQEKNLLKTQLDLTEFLESIH